MMSARPCIPVVDSPVPRSFCVNAFTHLNIDPDGRTKLCCHTDEHIRSGDRQMVLEIDTFDGIWSSDYLRTTRLKMAEGKPVGACLDCYDLENSGRDRFRLQANRRACEITGLPSLEAVFAWAAEEAGKREGLVDAPSSLRLWMGNLCNAKCRMCCGVYSTLIAADEVQSAWTGLYRQGIKTVITDLIPGLQMTQGSHGFGPAESVDGTPCHSVHGDGASVFFVTDDLVTDIYVSGLLQGSVHRELRVNMDGRRIFSADVEAGRWEERIRVLPFRASKGATITLKPGRGIGEFYVSHLAAKIQAPFESASSGGNVSKLPWSLAWTDETDTSLLASLKYIREVSLLGGEPLINSQTLSVLEVLAKHGAPESTGVFVHTNGTVFSRPIISQLKRFRWAVIAFSVDGVGDVLRYIRHPSNWEKVERNILAYRDEGVSVVMRPCLQTYNVFDAIEAVRFCDRHAIPFQFLVLSGPRYLSIEMLPSAVCEAAALQWEDYLENECPERSIADVVNLLDALRRPRPADGSDLERDFVRFTLELDRDRMESLESAIPRLYAELLSAGVQVGQRNTPIKVIDRVRTAKSKMRSLKDGTEPSFLTWEFRSIENDLAILAAVRRSTERGLSPQSTTPRRRPSRLLPSSP